MGPRLGFRAFWRWKLFERRASKMFRHVLGGHGDTMVPLSSCAASVGGIPVTQLDRSPNEFNRDHSVATARRAPCGDACPCSRPGQPLLRPRRRDSANGRGRWYVIRKAARPCPRYCDQEYGVGRLLRRRAGGTWLSGVEQIIEFVFRPMKRPHFRRASTRSRGL